MAMNENFKTFVVHVASIMKIMSIYLAKKAQIIAL